MKKNLIIYNPTSNAGHLDSWSSIFLKECLKYKNHNIYYLGSDIESIKNIIEDQEINQKIDFNNFFNFKEKVFLRVKSIFQKTFNLIFSKMLKKNLQYNFFYDPFYFYKNCLDLIKKKKLDPNKTFVINMFLDIYKFEKRYWIDHDEKNNFTWTGLHFHDVPARINSINSLKNNKFLIFIVEGLKNKYQNKENLYLPEFTFADTSKNNFKLKKNISLYAKKRKIIFMGGAIGKRKNLYTWSKMLEEIDKTKYYFIQIGKTFTSDLEFEDKMAFKSLLKKHPADIYIHNKYLKNEKEFNSLISMSDIIFAVYKNFSSSSNMISKSIFLKKPILVSEEGQMAKDVKKYMNGEIVEYNNVKSINFSIDKIIKNYNNYNFNHKELNKNLENFLRKILN